MVYLLLNEVLVFGVIWVDDLDRLPPALALGRVVGLEGEASQQRRERETLGVHTRLHQLVCAAHGGRAVDGDPGAGHGRDPEAEQDWVPVFRGPIGRALRGCLVGFVESIAACFTLKLALLLGVVLDVELCGGAVGGDDGY